MAKPEGVSWFAVYAPTDKLRLYFPNGDVRCAKCEWLYNEHGTNRCRCRISGEIVYEPNYPGLPESCLFEPTGEIRGHKYKEATP